ncbi:MAG: ABC transporter ATP-binding protein [Proteobacteria bacterium]|nr:ABC transporter ATP-binding protein [Pseudomonadota bacterium]
MTDILVARDLCKSYGEVRAVDGVSFCVRAGEIVGLLGPNGAGKTTTISLVLGILEPTSGRITIDGVDLTAERSKALGRTNFAAVYAPLPGNLSVRQNLTLAALLYSVPQRESRVAEVMQMLDLTRLADTRCGLLSSGEQSRVGLAKAFLNKPRLLLLDEPTASLDPATARDIREHIRSYVATEGGAVLWTSHNMHEVADVCDRVLFVSHGRVLLEGDPRTLPAEHGKADLDALFIAVAREPLSLEGVS